MVCAVFMAADAVEVVGDTLGEVLQSGDRAADGVSVLAVVTNNCFSICVAFYLIFFSRTQILHPLLFTARQVRFQELFDRL